MNILDKYKNNYTSFNYIENVYLLSLDKTNINNLLIKFKTLFKTDFQILRIVKLLDKLNNIISEKQYKLSDNINISNLVDNRIVNIFHKYINDKLYSYSNYKFEIIDLYSLNEKSLESLINIKNKKIIHSYNLEFKEEFILFTFLIDIKYNIKLNIYLSLNKNINHSYIIKLIIPILEETNLEKHKIDTINNIINYVKNILNNY